MNNKKDVVLALFGARVRREPMLIDTGDFITQSNAQLKQEGKPDVLGAAFNNLLAGETFLKIQDKVEPYLKAVYENQDSKKRSVAAREIAIEAMDLRIGKNPAHNLEQEIKNRVQNKNSSSPSMTLKKKP